MDRKLSEDQRDSIHKIRSSQAFRGPAFGASSIGLQELQLEVLLSIDQRLEEQNVIMFDMLSNWQGYRNMENN